MVLRVDVVAAALDGVYGGGPPTRVIALTPQGRPADPGGRRGARRRRSTLTLLSARFEGFDERIVEHLATDAISIGPYVLSSGELPAMVLLDAVARRSRERSGGMSRAVESFSAELDGGLEYPHYTRPAEFRGWRVPDVLLSGDHARIDDWRRAESRVRSRRVTDYEPPRPPSTRAARLRGQRTRVSADASVDGDVGADLDPERAGEGRGEGGTPSSWSGSGSSGPRRSRNPVVRLTATWPPVAPRSASTGSSTIVGAIADRARDQGVRRQSVPDPVVVDGADAPLRAARRRLRGPVLATACSRTASSTTSASPASRRHHRLQDATAAAERCGAGGTFVKRLIGAPGRDVGGAKRLRLHQRRSGSTSRTSSRVGATTARTRSGGSPRGTTSSWATTARSRATRATGARFRGRT